MRVSSRLVRASTLLLGLALSAVSLADTVTYHSGTLYVYDNSMTNLGRVDQGSGLGNAFRIIWRVGQPTDSPGVFHFIENGPGVPVNIFCGSCGTFTHPNGQVEYFDLQLGTVKGLWGSETVWYPIATSMRSLHEIVERRDMSTSNGWYVDAISGGFRLTPFLLDANGAPVNQTLVTQPVPQCNTATTNIQHCDMYWGPDDGGTEAVINFQVQNTESIWIPPADTSGTLCV